KRHSSFINHQCIIRLSFLAPAAFLPLNTPFGHGADEVVNKDKGSEPERKHSFIHTNDFSVGERRSIKNCAAHFFHFFLLRSTFYSQSFLAVTFFSFIFLYVIFD